jgi:cell division protein FtsI (penicillin-binding protein 3)
MAAIDNSGVLLKPYLVEKIVGADGAVILQRGREEVRPALRPETANTIGAMLEEVVRKGTGARAALTEYRAAGKTGTAQKVDPIRGGYSDKRLASFLGYAPAAAPRVAILVVIDEPEGKGVDITGGMVAAPAWGAIAREALRQLGVMPDAARSPLAKLPKHEPRLGPGPALGLGPGFGPGLGPDPQPGPGHSVVPDVAGLGARSAIRRLAERSLEPDLRGSGRAISQSPRPGAIVKRGARVRVLLAPPG